MNYETNATTIKWVKQRKGYLAAEGGMVYSKHCLSPRDVVAWTRTHHRQHQMKGLNHGQ